MKGGVGVSYVNVCFVFVFLTVATVYITMYIGLEKIVWFLNHVLYTSYNQFFELLKGCVGASSFNACLLLPLWLQEVCMVSFFLA